MNNEYGQCNICKATHTMQRVEATPGKSVYICTECLRKAKDAFIWNYVPWQQKLLKEMTQHAIAKYKRGLKK